MQNKNFARADSYAQFTGGLLGSARRVLARPRTKSEKWAGSHPTQKPIELVRRVILACTDEGDTVLDPFLGSGTTSVAAKMLNRNSIGIEKEKKYLSIIKKRLNPPQRKLNEESEMEIMN